MRKWLDSDHVTSEIPAGVRNWPRTGPTRADTLQKDAAGEFHFTNQSDDIPQPLTLIRLPDDNRYHPVFEISPGKYLEHFPDHMHEGETLGFGGVPESVPWILNDVLTFEGKKFVEYPPLDGPKMEKPLPRVIAMGSVLGGHSTGVEPNKLCESGFRPDPSETQEKKINTLSVYDGRKVGVGRVMTDSSFHHLADLNVIGDPCASGVKTRGLQTGFLDEMGAFVIKCVVWLANREVFNEPLPLPVITKVG
jgi:hypothetical protein